MVLVGRRVSRKTVSVDIVGGLKCHCGREGVSDLVSMGEERKTGALVARAAHWRATKMEEAFMLMGGRVVAGLVDGEGERAGPLPQGPGPGLSSSVASSDSEERNDSGSGRLTCKSNSGR